MFSVAWPAFGQATFVSDMPEYLSQFERRSPDVKSVILKYYNLIIF
jgi:hypothetical protein